MDHFEFIFQRVAIENACVYAETLKNSICITMMAIIVLDKINMLRISEQPKNSGSIEDIPKRKQ